VKDAQLFLVALEIFQPGVELEVFEFVFELSADELRGFKFLIALGLWKSSSSSSDSGF
jgi:hypothetical protein